MCELDLELGNGLSIIKSGVRGDCPDVQNVPYCPSLEYRDRYGHAKRLYVLLCVCEGGGHQWAG